MPLRVMIMGTGAVGSYFGAKLVQGGCDVKFVARGEQLAALREQGLQIESKLGHIHLRQVRASDNPTELGSADFVLICVKLWDTEAAAQAILPIIKPNTTVISLQNGVEKDDVLRTALGEQSVVGGVCFIGAKILQPGVISHTGTMQKLIFGEYDGSNSARVQTFLDICRKSGIEAELATDIRRAIWEKFVFLVGMSAATATMRSCIGQIRSNPQTRAFLLDVMRETVAVGRAHGISLDADFAEDRLAFCDKLPSEMKSSMLNDLEQGNRLEVEWLSGAVVKLGKAVGIETPLNRAVNDILALQANGSIH